MSGLRDSLETKLPIPDGADWLGTKLYNDDLGHDIKLRLRDEPDENLNNIG